VTWIRRVAPLAAVCLIAALTFPWRLEDHAHWGNIRWWPFGDAIVRPHDVLGNLLLYVPLGLTVPGASRRARLVTAFAVGTALSLGIELAQVWSHHRIPTLLDVLLNVTGSLMGACLSGRRASRR
jgi:glycopeptide antibiotics resistance protein